MGPALWILVLACGAGGPADLQVREQVMRAGIPPRQPSALGGLVGSTTCCADPAVARAATALLGLQRALATPGADLLEPAARLQVALWRLGEEGHPEAGRLAERLRVLLGADRASWRAHLPALVRGVSALVAASPGGRMEIATVACAPTRPFLAEGPEEPSPYGDGCRPVSRRQGRRR